jgi:hypothetical protein
LFQFATYRHSNVTTNVFAPMSFNRYIQMFKAHNGIALTKATLPQVCNPLAADVAVNIAADADAADAWDEETIIRGSQLRHEHGGEKRREGRRGYEM